MLCYSVVFLGDYTSNFYLYGLTLCSVLLQSFYQTEVEKLAEEENITPYEILYINALNTLPVLILIFAATGEYIEVFNSDLWNERKWLSNLSITRTPFKLTYIELGI